MSIQNSLLLEQLGLLKRCQLGRRMMGGLLPDTVSEFRSEVPLTNYRDYYADLLSKRKDILPAKPLTWIRDLGLYDEYPAKMIPVTKRCWEELEFVAAAAVIFAGGKNCGELSGECRRILRKLAGGMSGYFSSIEDDSVQTLDFILFPHPHVSDDLPLEEQLKENYKLILKEGICGAMGKAWLLAAVGQHFEFTLRDTGYLSKAGDYRVWLRLLSGLVRCKIAGRTMFPRDLWRIAAVIATGSDRIFYRDKIHRNWGIIPLYVYGSAESMVVAMQTWDRSALTFIPQLNFLEFIPEREYKIWLNDRCYQPRTVVIDEVTAGESYELVITNFHGGPLVRYRTGDIIRITAPGDKRYGIEIPQMVFERKIDDIIDLGYMYLTEKLLQHAIDNTHIPYINWTARKEMHEQKPVLHMYIEIQEGYIASEAGMAAAVYNQIKKLNQGFMSKDIASLEKLTGISPIKATLLPAGAFYNYLQRCRIEDISGTPVLPPRINPTDKMLCLLGAKAKVIAEMKDSIKSYA